jgi:tetratricopeptide (TPR) repeat protein
MKYKVIFIVFFLVYLIACYFHFQWEKYYDEYFAAAYDPYPVLSLEIPTRIDNAGKYFNLGLESSMIRNKIEYFTKALELDPMLADAYEKRGMLYYFQERYDNVIQDFSTYLDLATPKAEAYRMLGLGYLKRGACPEAVRNFTRAIEMEPELAAAYANRAEAHRLCEMYAETIRDSTRTISLGKDPTTRGDAYRTRAMAYRKIGRNDLAGLDTRAIALEDPRYPFLRFMSDSASLEDTKKMGLIGIIGIVFVLIFRLKFKPPQKDD